MMDREHKIPAVFPVKPGRDGAGFGDFGVWRQHSVASTASVHTLPLPGPDARLAGGGELPQYRRFRPLAAAEICEEAILAGS